MVENNLSLFMITLLNHCALFLFVSCCFSDIILLQFICWLTISNHERERSVFISSVSFQIPLPPSFDRADLKVDFNHKKRKSIIVSILNKWQKGLQMGIITLMEFINLTRYVSYCGQLYELLKIALNDLVCKLELWFFLNFSLISDEDFLETRNEKFNSTNVWFHTKENASNEKRESFHICFFLDLLTC